VIAGRTLDLWISRSTPSWRWKDKESSTWEGLGNVCLNQPLILGISKEWISGEMSDALEMRRGLFLKIIPLLHGQQVSLQRIYVNMLITYLTFSAMWSEQPLDSPY